MHEVEIERLLQWAYRDELPKRGIGDVANQWAPMREYFDLLTIVDEEPGFPVIMGAPHPDALTIERAVQGLAAELQLEWREYRPLLMGDMPMLAPVASPFVIEAPHARGAQVKMLGANAARVVRKDAPARLMVFSEVALVEQCARMGRQPQWDVGTPSPRRVLGGNYKPVVIGGSEGHNRYSTGAHCPLRYDDPSIEKLVVRRAEYLIWRGAIDRLVGTLRAWLLQDHVPLKTTAPLTPWLDRAVVTTSAPIPGPSSWRTWSDDKPKRRRQRTASVAVPSQP